MSTDHEHHTHSNGPPEDVHQFTDVRWRYFSGFYDGPLSGMVWVGNGEFIVGEPVYEPLWAECYDECTWYPDDDQADLPSPCSFYRRYKLIRLTPESAAAEKECHDLFVKHVGDHWEIDEYGNRKALAERQVKPQNEWHKFYDAYKDKPVEHVGEVVGWFEL